MVTFPAAALAHFDKAEPPVDSQAHEKKLAVAFNNARAAFESVYGQKAVEAAPIDRPPIEPACRQLR